MFGIVFVEATNTPFKNIRKSVSSLTTVRRFFSQAVKILHVVYIVLVIVVSNINVLNVSFTKYDKKPHQEVHQTFLTHIFIHHLLQETLSKFTTNE